MFTGTIFCPPINQAVSFAGQYLSSLGLQVTDHPRPDTDHLLLPVPSFSGGWDYLPPILEQLPENICISGGNLNIPPLAPYKTVDFLQDHTYLADNAAITAECTLQILERRTELNSAAVLILGWGRIGKCLGFLLRDRGAEVTIAARKESDLAMIHALDFHSVPISHVAAELSHYAVILNTVPEMLLPRMACRKGCIALELASKPGMAADHVISARGLPGKMAPAKSGRLIAETFIRLSL